MSAEWEFFTHNAHPNILYLIHNYEKNIKSHEHRQDSKKRDIWYTGYCYDGKGKFFRYACQACQKRVPTEYVTQAKLLGTVNYGGA